MAFHADLSFPRQRVGRNDSTCFCVFVCEATGFVVLFAQRSKAKAVDSLKRLHRFVENSAAMRPKDVGELAVIHTDQGTGFMSNRWASARAPFEQGVAHSCSAKETPQHNGMAERANWTIKERVAAALLDSGLGDECWEFACRYAVHTINQSLRADNRREVRNSSDAQTTARLGLLE